MRFEPEYPVAKLKPAEYNPRRISLTAMEKLKDSLRSFGVVKPLILNGEGKIAAGHQRLRACLEIALESVPAVILDRVSEQDEITFNLFHNRVETNKSEVLITGVSGQPGFSLVRFHQIEYQENRNPVLTTEIGKLIIKYGPWGSVVIDQAGQVLDNSDYAVASKALKQDLLVFQIPKGQEYEFLKYLGIDYGEYCYDALKIPAYNQHHCQMQRLTGTKRLNRSTVYERLVLPSLKKSQRLIDFGAGKCAYVNRLRREGFKALAYEPHFVGPDGEIDIEAVVSQIKEIEADVKEYGLYDMVVLDGVLNSITSLEFECMVLTTCNALTASDGVLCLGTRSYDFAKQREFREQSTRQADKRLIQFYDSDRFSATFRNGVWAMQRFHTVGSLREVLSRFFDEVEVIDHKRSDIWAVCRKPLPLAPGEVAKALEVEFNMEYPGGARHRQHETLVADIIRHFGERS